MDIPGMGVLISLMVIALFGYFMRYYAGRRLIQFSESILERLPLVSGVYQGLKQFIETLFSSKGRQFSEVVMIEYPRKGIYCLAFVTNRTDYVKGKGTLVSIFLPTTPNPTSGFFLLIPQDEILSIDISVEEAFKLIMSAGLVAPEQINVQTNLLDQRG